MQKVLFALKNFSPLLDRRLPPAEDPSVNSTEEKKCCSRNPNKSVSCFRTMENRKICRRKQQQSLENNWVFLFNLL